MLSEKGAQNPPRISPKPAQNQAKITKNQAKIIQNPAISHKIHLKKNPTHKQKSINFQV